MNCYFSTNAFPSKNLLEILAMSVREGLDVELSSAVSYSPDLLECLNPAPAEIRFLVHNYFPPPAKPFVLNLASVDPVIHDQSVALCRAAIDLCSQLEAPFYSVHAGFAFHLSPFELGDPDAQKKLSSERMIPRKKALGLFTKTIRELIEYAEAKGVGLLVENNVLARENLLEDGQSPLLLADIDEIRDFFREMDDPRTGLLLDTGHAKVTALTRGIPVERYMEELKPLVRGMHLSDNDGHRDTNQPFDEKAWFGPFLKDLAAIPMVIEVNRLPVDELLRQRQVVKNLLH